MGLCDWWIQALCLLVLGGECIYNCGRVIWGLWGSEVLGCCRWIYTISYPIISRINDSFNQIKETYFKRWKNPVTSSSKTRNLLRHWMTGDREVRDGTWVCNTLALLAKPRMRCGARVRCVWLAGRSSWVLVGLHLCEVRKTRLDGYWKGLDWYRGDICDDYIEIECGSNTVYYLPGSWKAAM